MTPVQKIKHLILLHDAEQMGAYGDGDPVATLPDIDAENIDDVFEQKNDDWGLQDAINEFREGQYETGLKCEWSRHYESKAVAAKYIDGSYVGWTYWYGGGKHGEPEAIDWLGEAYSVDCVEEEKVVTVRTFTVPETAANPA